MRKSLCGMYAQSALQDAYCARTRNQLFGKEEEVWEKENGNQRLDTNAAVLSGRKFADSVRRKVNKRKKNDAAKEMKAAQMKTYRRTKARWEEDERLRIQRNKTGRAQHKNAMMAWEAEKRAARQEDRDLDWERPGKFVVEKSVAKPACPGRGQKRKAVTAQLVTSSSDPCPRLPDTSRPLSGAVATPDRTPDSP
jgi:hypothetical protein